MSDKLEFTGERFTPECMREIWYEHFHRYVFARELVRGKRVLDAACGEGYGSALLAQAAESVEGVDLSVQAIEHARVLFRSDTLRFKQADCTELPFEEGEFDCVVSFETLEHLEQHEKLLREFRRVLKPEGFLLISTPDKAIYTDRLKNSNEYHLRELYRPEFESLLASEFPAFRLWGQKLLFQSALWSLQPQSGVQFQQDREGQVSETSVPVHEPVYLLALCAAQEDFLPSPGSGVSLFDDAAESVYQHYYHEIRKNMSTGQMLIDKDREINELKAQLASSTAKLPWWRRWFGKA